MTKCLRLHENIQKEEYSEITTCMDCGMESRDDGITWYNQFFEDLRSLTAKPSRSATQRERNIYRSASALLAALEEVSEV